MEDELKQELENSLEITGKEYQLSDIPEEIIELIKSDKEENIELGISLLNAMDEELIDKLYTDCVENSTLKESNKIIKIIIEKIVKGEIELVNDLVDNELNRSLIEELEKLIKIKK